MERREATARDPAVPLMPVAVQRVFGGIEYGLLLPDANLALVFQPVRVVYLASDARKLVPGPHRAEEARKLARGQQRGLLRQSLPVCRVENTLRQVTLVLAFFLELWRLFDLFVCLRDVHVGETHYVVGVP